MCENLSMQGENLHVPIEDNVCGLGMIRPLLSWEGAAQDCLQTKRAVSLQWCNFWPCDDHAPAC